MPDIQRIELERENDVGVQVQKPHEHGDLPVKDPAPADDPKSPIKEPPEKDRELEARDSEAVLQRAIRRFPPG